MALQTNLGEVKANSGVTCAAVGAWLRSMILGHLQYYRVPMKLARVLQFRAQVECLWHRVLAPRSQRGPCPLVPDAAAPSALDAPACFQPNPLQRFDARTSGKSPVRESLYCDIIIPRSP
jgi:RNA-directed DNA polymerase